MRPAAARRGDDLLLGLAAAALLPAPAGGGIQAQAATAPVPRAQEASARAGFAVSYHGQVVPWRVFLLRALPGEEVALEVRAASEAVGAPAGVADRLPGGHYRLRADGGGVERTGPRSWIWTAPGPTGMHRLAVVREVRPASRTTAGEGAAPSEGSETRVDGAADAPADSVVLHAAVLVPLSEVRRGRVGGFRVGAHPDEVYRDLPRYRPPRGFVRVTRENADTPVSPRFRLGSFSVKRPTTWPKYTVLHERLLLKLELLVERAADRGVPPGAWRVLSAYRSPWYNRDIGRPRFSRHVFGDAADVYVDADGDGRMDDLNRDGRVDVEDAGVLHDIVRRMDADPATRHLLGGLGSYPTTSTHGPFIHVDTRGYRARW